MTNEEKYKTAEERVKAFSMFCENQGKCASCPAFGRIGNCHFNWIALEAEEEKPMPCPFCGGEMVGRFNSFGPSIWSGQCACGYKTKDFLTNVEVIAAHNCVCRAVKAAKEYRDRTREKRLSYAHAYYQSHKMEWNKKKEAHHA